MLHRPLGTAAALLALLATAATPAAAEAVDPTGDYIPGGAPVTTTWFALADPAARAADRRYVEGMRAHHRGAVTMAEEYLRDPEARSPVLRRLARAIIANQGYEIALLDEVERLAAAPPSHLRLGPFRLELQPVGTEGLGQVWRFQKAPIPGPAALLAEPPATERDVQFAKGMTLHHEAALRMAREYGADPAARNGFLKWLNVGIVTDQTQEIALMRAVVARFPGDPASVVVDPAMVHGMPGEGGGAAPAADPHAHHHH